MINLVCLFFGFCFLILYFYRATLNSEIEVEAQVVESIEVKIEIPDRYFSYYYYYPEIEYRYSYKGIDYVGIIGKKESRQFRVSELDNYGAARKEEEYFWRKIKKGDAINIVVNENKPQISRIADYINKNFLSEKYVFLVLALAFLLVGVFFN